MHSSINSTQSYKKISKKYGNDKLFGRMNKRFSGCHPLGTLHIMYFTSMPVVFPLSCTALHSHTPMDGLTTEVDIKFRSVIA